MIEPARVGGLPVEELLAAVIGTGSGLIVMCAALAVDEKQRSMDQSGWRAAWRM